MYSLWAQAYNTPYYLRTSYLDLKTKSSEYVGVKLKNDKLMSYVNN